MAKTVKVKDLVDAANSRMANPKLTQEEKAIVYLFVDDFLHRTKNYAGFGYLELPPTKENEYNRFFYYHQNIK